MMDWSSLSIPPLSITNYSPDAWHNWFNKFKLITKATTFSSLGDPQKVAVLLMKLGSEITPIFDEFGVDVDDISYDDLVRRFTLYFQPLKARNVLLNLKQKSGESFEQFAERLTVHSYPCVFGPGTFRENYLCDVFLNNIEDRYCHVRSKILESYPYLEFRKVVEIANKLFLEECGFNRSAAHNGFPSFPGTHEDSKLCNFDSQVFQGAGQGNHRSQNQGANRGPRAYPSVPSFRLNPIHHDDIVDVQILTKHTDITYVSPVSYEETRKAFFKFFNEKQRKNPIKVELGKRYAVQFDEKWYRVDVASIQPSNTASVQSVDFGWRKHFPLSELHNLELDCISQKPMSLMVTFENTNKNPKEGERVTLKFLSNENGLWTVRLLENDLNKKYKQNQGGNRNKFGPDEQKPKRDELDSDILQSQTETSSTSSNNTKTGQDLKGKGSHYNKREQVTGNRNVFVPDEQKPKMREQNDRREQKSNMSVDHVNKETSTGRTGNKNQNDRRGQNYQADSRDDFNSNRHQSKTNRNSGGNRNSNQETKMTGQDSDGFKHYGGEKKQNNKTTIPDGGLKDDGNSRRTSGGNKGEHAGNERGSGFNNQRSGGGKDHGGDYKVPDGDFRNDGGSQRTSGGNRGENSGRERGGGFNNRRSGGGKDHGGDYKVPDGDFRSDSNSQRASGGNERGSGFNTQRFGGGRDYGGDYKVPTSGFRNDSNSQRTSGGNKGEYSGNERGSGFNDQRSGGVRDHGGDYKMPDDDFRGDGNSQRTNGGNRGENSGRERGGGFNNRRSGGGRDNGSDSKVPDNYFRDNGNSQRTSGGNQGEHKGSERGGGNNRRSGGMRDDVAITQMAVGNNPIPGIADIQIDDLPIPKDRFTKVTFLNQVGPVAYVYPKSCDKEFQNMMEHLGKISEDPSLCRVLRDPKKGMFCAAPYDGDLYRAKILGVKEKSVKVLFFDFGNEEIVPRDSLVVLPDSLSDSQWSFRIKAPESFNVDDLLSGDVIEVRPKFMDSEGVCVVDVDGYNSDLAVQAPSVVNASRSSTDTPRSPHVDDTGRGDKSKSPRQTLREAEPVRSDSSKSRKMAQPVDDAPVRTPRPPIPKNTFSEVQVAYVGAEGCFVIALADLEILREIHQDINAEPLTACSTLAINQVCAAPFEGDIFRAKILSINRIESLCSVEFIDFGNITEIHTDDLLELPARLTKGVYAFKIKFDCDRVLEVNESISISPITLESDGAWLVQLEGEPLTADYQLPSESGGSIDERDDFIEFSRNANKNPNRRNQR